MKFENVAKLLAEFGEIENNRNEVVSVNIGWYKISFDRGCSNIDIMAKIGQEYKHVGALKKIKEAREYLKRMKQRVSQF